MAATGTGMNKTERRLVAANTAATGTGAITTEDTCDIYIYCLFGVD